jgi:hypothetical protein
VKFSIVDSVLKGVDQMTLHVASKAFLEDERVASYSELDAKLTS